MAEAAQPMSQTKIYQIDEELSRIKNQKKTLKVLGDSEARVQVLTMKIWEIQ
jgi:DNA repair protein RAD50